MPPAAHFHVWSPYHSDPHGLVRAEAVAAPKGCQHILHAGDVDELDVLVKLRKLAPVTVVRGNNDR